MSNQFVWTRSTLLLESATPTFQPWTLCLVWLLPLGLPSINLTENHIATLCDLKETKYKLSVSARPLTLACSANALTAVVLCSHPAAPVLDQPLTASHTVTGSDISWQEMWLEDELRDSREHLAGAGIPKYFCVVCNNPLKECYCKYFFPVRGEGKEGILNLALSLLAYSLPIHRAAARARQPAASHGAPAQGQSSPAQPRSSSGPEPQACPPTACQCLGPRRNAPCLTHSSSTYGSGLWA